MMCRAPPTPFLGFSHFFGHGMPRDGELLSGGGWGLLGYISNIRLGFPSNVKSLRKEGSTGKFKQSPPGRCCVGKSQFVS